MLAMHDQITDNQEHIGALGAAAVAGKNAPPIAVAGMTMAGVSLQDWVYVLTIAWLVVQLAWFCYSKYKAIKSGKHGE